MMSAQQRVPWVLAVGFALTIVVLFGAAWFSVRAVDAVESHTERLLQQHRMSTQLIDDMQDELSRLSGLFYELVAGPQPADRKQLLERLTDIESDLRRTLDESKRTASKESWGSAQPAVERFSTEMRQLLSHPPAEIQPSFFRAHEALVQAIAALVTANHQQAIEQENLGSSEHRKQLNRALLLVVVGLLLALICAGATVRGAVSMFRRTEWQARELSRLSGHVLGTQEQMLHRFSRELHDEFGQALTAIEANLAAVPADRPEVAARLEDCTLLVKDLMSNVREYSQLLRPSTLDDFGLAPSLQWLADSFAQRTGISVDTRLTFRGRLDGETETHLFRIAQEALTNVTRHTQASRVDLVLEQRGKVVRLRVTDNGGGMRPRRPLGPGGMGLAGMRERMRVAGGQLHVSSSPHGVTVAAEVTIDETTGRNPADSRPAGG